MQGAIEHSDYDNAELNHFKAFHIFFSVFTYCSSYILYLNVFQIIIMYLITGMCNTKTAPLFWIMSAPFCLHTTTLRK